MATSDNGSAWADQIADKRSYAEHHGYGFHAFLDLDAPGRTVRLRCTAPAGLHCAAQRCAALPAGRPAHPGQCPPPNYTLWRGQRPAAPTAAANRSYTGFLPYLQPHYNKLLAVLSVLHMYGEHGGRGGGCGH